MPLDFVSTHVYGNDSASDVFDTDEKIPRRPDGLPRGEEGPRRDQIVVASDMPLIWSEYNAAYDNEVAVTDSIYMGPWLATTIAQCDGLTEMMSLWTFSDVFEEQGVVKTPFYGGFGLIAAGNIPKPSFYAMQLLHGLGDQRIENGNPNILVTKAKDGSLVVAVWNLVNPGSTGEAKTVKLQFKGMRRDAKVSVRYVDDEHGNTLGAWARWLPPPGSRPARCPRCCRSRPARWPCWQRSEPGTYRHRHRGASDPRRPPARNASPVPGPSHLGARERPGRTGQPPRQLVRPPASPASEAEAPSRREPDSVRCLHGHYP